MHFVIFPSKLSLPSEKNNIFLCGSYTKSISHVLVNQQVKEMTDQTLEINVCYNKNNSFCQEMLLSYYYSNVFLRTTFIEPLYLKKINVHEEFKAKRGVGLLK